MCLEVAQVRCVLEIWLYASCSTAKLCTTDFWATNRSACRCKPLTVRISLKVSLSEKSSGTFPSVFGDCFRKVPPKSAYPKKFRNIPECFWGTASENFPQKPPPRKKFGNVPECFWGLLLKIPQSQPIRKNSGTFPSVFGDCFRKVPQSLPPRKNSRVFLGLLPKIPPKVSLPEKKIRERSRVCFWGLLPNISPKVGNVPEYFGDCFRKFPPKSASPKKIRERSRVFLGTASENFPQSLPPRKKIGNVPECFWGLLPKISPNVCLPKKIREHSRSHTICQQHGTLKQPMPTPKWPKTTVPLLIGRSDLRKTNENDGSLPFQGIMAVVKQLGAEKRKAI